MVPFLLLSLCVFVSFGAIYNADTQQALRRSERSRRHSNFYRNDWKYSPQRQDQERDERLEAAEFKAIQEAMNHGNGGDYFDEFESEESDDDTDSDSSDEEDHKPKYQLSAFLLSFFFGLPLCTFFVMSSKNICIPSDCG